MTNFQLNLGLTKSQKVQYALIKKHQPSYILFPAGRRYGKTEFAVRWQSPKVFSIPTTEDSPHGWISPGFRQAKLGFYKYQRFLKKNRIPYKARIADVIIDLFGNPDYRIQFFSADKPELMEGFSLKSCVLEEAGILLKKREVWENTIQPMLIDHDAVTLGIGTPKGTGLYKEMYLKGKDPQNKDFLSLHATTYDNAISKGGFLKDAVIDRIVRNMHQRAVQQEIMAEFLDEGGTVFRGLTKVLYGGPFSMDSEGVILAKPYSSKLKYIGGLDIAKVNDWTVLAIGTQTEVHYIERFNQLDWHIIKDRIIRACKKYTCKVIMDSTGVGDPIYEDLRVAGLAITGYKYTHQSKQDLINKLIVAIENGEIKLPNWRVLIDEFDAFEYQVSPAGNIKMNAMVGFHDDIVNGVALWNWLRSVSMTDAQIDGIWLGDDIESSKNW